MSSCIKKVEIDGDELRKNAIIAIIRKEVVRKRWRHGNRTTKKPRGGQVLSVKVHVGELTETYDTEDGIFGAVSSHLSKRFRLAFTAPCMKGKLFNDISFIGDRTCAQQILDGTYVFSPDTDAATIFCWKKRVSLNAK